MTEPRGRPPIEDCPECPDTMKYRRNAKDYMGKYRLYQCPTCGARKKIYLNPALR